MKKHEGEMVAEEKKLTKTEKMKEQQLIKEVEKANV